jgi:hypothetical protein
LALLTSPIPFGFAGGFLSYSQIAQQGPHISDGRNWIASFRPFGL